MRKAPYDRNAADIKNIGLYRYKAVRSDVFLLFQFKTFIKLEEIAGIDVGYLAVPL